MSWSCPQYQRCNGQEQRVLQGTVVWFGRLPYLRCMYLVFAHWRDIHICQTYSVSIRGLDVLSLITNRYLTWNEPQKFTTFLRMGVEKMYRSLKQVIRSYWNQLCHVMSYGPIFTLIFNPTFTLTFNQSRVTIKSLQTSIDKIANSSQTNLSCYLRFYAQKFSALGQSSIIPTGEEWSPLVYDGN